MATPSDRKRGRPGPIASTSRSMPVPGWGPQVRSRRESGLKTTPEWGWGSPGPSPTTAPVSASRRRTWDSGCPPGPLAVDVAISRPSGLTAVIPYGPDGPSEISSASRGRPTGTERVGSPRRSRPHRRRPRPPTVRRCLPSRPKDTARIGPGVRSGGAIGPARGTSQIGIVPSSSPMARARPSGLNARHRTVPTSLNVCPLWRSVVESQSRTVPPSVPVAKRSPSGEIARLVTVAPSGGRVKLRNDAGSQTRTCSSRVATRIRRPPPTKATLRMGEP